MLLCITYSLRNTPSANNTVKCDEFSFFCTTRCSIAADSSLGQSSVGPQSVVLRPDGDADVAADVQSGVKPLVGVQHNCNRQRRMKELYFIYKDSGLSKVNMMLNLHRNRTAY